MLIASSVAPLVAQDLSPRAYVITPLRSNAVTLSYSYYSGSIQLNGVLPNASATGTYSVPIFTGYHSFGIFGRSGNVFHDGQSERVRHQERAGTYWADKVIAVSHTTKRELTTPGVKTL